MTDPTTGETWRFDVSPHDGTITRGRKYRLPDDYSGDNWRHYWDGDCMVAVYDSTNYHSPTTGDATERVEYAIRMCREYDQDIDAMLARLARRIEGNWPAGFASVGVERGVTLYALMWDASDPEHVKAWADEIECVYYGDVWRIEVERWDAGLESWQPEDEVYEEWYGETLAQEGFEKEFPMADAPDALLVSSEN